MEKVAILARHGRTAHNADWQARSPKSRVQGEGLRVPLDSLGDRQSRALGLPLGRCATRLQLNIVGIHASDTDRTISSRDLTLSTVDLAAPILPPTSQLREISKGDLEGRLRSEVYPTDEIVRQQAIDWHFRHGSPASGGQTGFEASSRWLDWFNEAWQSLPDPAPGFRPTLVAFGHSFVTAAGLWRLFNPDIGPNELPSLQEVDKFRTKNGQAILLAQRRGKWLLSRIIPTAEDLKQFGIDDSS